MARKVYIENMPLDQALDLVMNRLQSVVEFRIEEEEMEVQQSLGRITAEPIRARKSSPITRHQPWMGLRCVHAIRWGRETTPVLLYRDQHFVEVDTGIRCRENMTRLSVIEDVNYKDENTGNNSPGSSLAACAIRGRGPDSFPDNYPAFFPVGPFEIGSC